MAKQFHYNVTGEKRKALVRAVSEILGEDAVYKGAPTFAYEVDGYTISRNGTVICPDNADYEEIAHLMTALYEQGYMPENLETRITVEIPRDDFSEKTFENLKKIIASKAAVLKKALETDSLEFKVTEDKILFPWFTLHDLDGEAYAYTHLAAAMCKMAKEQKRVTAKEQDIGNDKLTMRLFLVRLGLIGNKYKLTRKILLRNLTGNSSWKYGRPAERQVSTNVNSQAEVPYEKQQH